jgi:hypothetical protein
MTTEAEEKNEEEKPIDAKTITATNEAGMREFDLLKLYTKPVSEMTDEELQETLLKLRATRKVKIATTKKAKTRLDIILGAMDLTTAQKILQKLGSK